VSSNILYVAKFTSIFAHQISNGMMSYSRAQQESEFARHKRTLINMSTSTGIHHAASMARQLQLNKDTCTGVNGLALFDWTEDFDNAYTDQLHCWDEVGSLLTPLTFSTFGEGCSGRVKRGKASPAPFVISEDLNRDLTDRFESHDIEVEFPQSQIRREGPSILDQQSTSARTTILRGRIRQRLGELQ